MYKPKTIPTPLALAVILIGIVGGVFLTRNLTGLSSKAGLSPVPEEIKITNVTDTSFTVSWITKERATGAVVFGEDKKMGQIAFDERDGKTPGTYFTHYATLSGLRPQTLYHFQILSGGKKFGIQDKPFSQNTGTTLLPPPRTIDPAYGKVFLPSDQPAQGAIVYAGFNSAFPQSALVKESGSWLVSLNLIRTADLKNYFTPGKDEKEEIFIQGGTAASYILTNTKNDSPVPDVVLGKNYDFQKISKRDSVQIAQEKPQVLGEKTQDYEVAIFFPQDQEAISFFRPLFRGTGIPGKEVKIRVESSPQEGKTTVLPDGTWSWTPLYALNPGNHSLTITTVNQENTPVTLKRDFIILKSGESVLGDATPSGTLTPTSLPSPTLILTLTPTSVASPTPPTSGVFAPSLAILGIGSLLLMMGIIF